MEHRRTTAPAALRVALLVSAARTAARSGDPDGALRLLESAADPDVGGHRDVLDLSARLYAQRGEPDLAARYWRRVQKRYPDDRAAAAGLARTERYAARNGPRAPLARRRVRVALAVTACLTAAVATAALVGTGNSRSGQAEQQARRLPARQQAAVQEQARAAAHRVRETQALARALRAPGLRPAVRGDSVVVAFVQGLFSGGADLTPTGADRLAVLGRHLAGRTVRIGVYGHTAVVPGAPAHGGSVVALWRALVAARELSAASGKPLTAFTTASADQRDAPYAGVERNRTVTVVVTPG